jgi:hypothetical protein
MPRYLVQSITVDEAAMQLGDGDELFLVFRNAATEAVHVIYRRARTGDFGLIDTGSSR